MTGFSEYDAYDGLGLAELVRNGEVTPGELAEEAITRIEKLNPELNAVIHKTYELGREAAARIDPDAPFAGVPFLLKDLLATCAGVPTCNGSRFYEGFVPDHDSEMVKRFKAAGVVILGKTNVPELGMLPVTDPELFGPSRNPWDLTLTPGGSSGGSAAAVAARMVPLAHGSDGGGSIRIPSSCCGLFGLKPTRGRTPLGPDVAEAWQGFSCGHVLTRSVRDSAAMLDAIAGPDPGALYVAPPPRRPFLEEVGRDPGTLRIAFTAEPILPGTVHPGYVAGLERAVALCRDLGHEVVEDAPDIDGSAFARAFLTMVCAETRADIEEAQELLGRKATARDFEPGTWAVALLGSQISAAEFSKALHFLKRTGRRMAPFFQTYDVLLTPTLAGPPLPIGALQPQGAELVAMKALGALNAGGLINALTGIDALADEVYRFMPYTPPFNTTGQPAVSVPLHWNGDGLPIGMQFVGRFGDEATLFRLGAQLEDAAPWADRVPPIAA